MTTLLDNITQALHTDGYSITTNAFPSAELHALLQHLKSLHQTQFQQAGIGRQAQYQINQAIRTDRIYWLETNQPQAALQPFLDFSEALRQHLNRHLFLGLWDYECHYAYYPEGAFYKKHVDAFQGKSSRRVSTVLYLNPDWQHGDGGELQLYQPNETIPFHTVLPQFGTLLIFLSEQFPHEVSLVNRARYSLTGWYRVSQANPA